MKLTRSIKKYIRTEKARIRKTVVGKKEQKEQIELLYKKVVPKKKT